MIRIIAVILAGMASVPVASSTARAADLARLEGAGPAPGRWHHRAGGRIAGTVAARGRPQYSYYGEYGYPAPFGYGYAYAPVPSRGFEYGYNGPRYVWTAPDSYAGPAFGYHVW
ncbi:hypothetical protein [Methylobacterium sp. 13MFTsu3.1M2]|uniref:hypothetical protein n=1 Tax=Methylobacterium sp. 13MFTsu3.1M2 TaxID=1502776 RepID=UPI0008F32BF3|nr:hypothetical protein [Methylobacterium sp. 13MFTsu3.1M2]SFD77406.1 hypothetical protein SAMN02799627_01571 [Methylobacterium sp. 13MFTsu3.1M2]